MSDTIPSPSEQDELVLGEHRFRSRLITGTGKYADHEVAAAALAASGCEMVTVAVRRVDLSDRSETSVFGVLAAGGYTVLPNTAGCYDAESAVRTARLAREMLDTTLVKVEVIGDPKTLYPDVPGTLEACATLVKEGFTVLPYITDDPVTCKRLEDLGCAAVMPLAGPIGSGLGVCNPYSVELIVQQSKVPVIVDAGVGTASDATAAMELGVDGLLMNTAIAQAKDPVRMARAMRAATEAGRDAFLAGRIPRKLYATASSPLEGVIGSDT
ncbi:MAG: thiazole synthase [Myxococcota bacterium]